tara:strand:- start:567 stop:1724 length:1158 start_codon:yes stop_codon:yes gene_type:complete
MNREYVNYLTICLLISLGLYLCFTGGYGSDEDTLALIGAYESMLGGGTLMASRFTPYPVAEIGIGFLSYQFGSSAANVSTFLFILFSAMFFYYSFNLKQKNKNLIFFLILVLTNPVIFFDNLEPIDYSWALLPLSIGMYCLKKKYYEVAIIFFGISIGARIYFFLFLVPIIFLIKYSPDLKISRKILMFFGSFFIGGLFYLPFWIENGFALDWITAATPYSQGFLGIISRFLYKIAMSFSILTFVTLFVIFIILKIKNKIKYENNLIGIITVNLLIFIFIPAELSYLQPFLFCIYYLIFLNFNPKILYMIVILNLLSWIVEVKPLEIQYKSDDICNNVEAVGANININISQGRLFEHIDSRQKIKCWINDNSERSQKILKGKALK